MTTINNITRDQMIVNSVFYVNGKDGRFSNNILKVTITDIKKSFIRCDIEVITEEEKILVNGPAMWSDVYNKMIYLNATQENKFTPEYKTIHPVFNNNKIKYNKKTNMFYVELAGDLNIFEIVNC